MKLFYLLVFICLLSVDAQRRSVKSELLSENEPALKSARRGRARFTADSDSPQIEETKRSESPNRRFASRRRPETHTVAAPVRNNYEVDEIVDETPIEFRKPSKIKVLTETSYEARNAPLSNALFQPSTTENLDDFIRSIGSDISDDTTSSSIAASSTVSTSLEPSSPDLTSSEITKIDNEISRTQPESTTPLTVRTTKRSNGRFRSSDAPSADNAAPRVRTRTRANRKPEEQNTPQASTRTVQRPPRRRTEAGVGPKTKVPSAENVEPTRARFGSTEAKTRAPPVITSAETAELPTRPRFGSTEARTKAPPVITSAETAELPSRSRFESRTRAQLVASAETPRPRVEPRTRAPPVIASAETAELPTRSRFEPRTRAQVVAETAVPARPRVRTPSAESVELPSRSRVNARTRGPSVIASAESVELPSRLRSGRRIPTRNEELKPEKISLDLPRSRAGGRASVESTTARSRVRSRFKEIPPVIDEQILEVLPLFESEAKTVRPVRKLVSRRRSFNSAEEVETSATENDVKVAPKPPKQSVVVETRTESSIKRRKPTSRLESRARTTSRLVSRTSKPSQTVKTTTKPTVTTSIPTQITKSTIKTSKPIIKESVVSEITEVTSKRTITRNKVVIRNKVELPKFVTRGSKKPEVNLTSAPKKKPSLTSSEEDIDDSDNYPEPFKALIQAKKQNKESRPHHRLVTAAPAVTKSTEKVVNSSPSTTTQVISTEANRQLEDSENELDPTKLARPTRRRFSQSTEKATRPTRKSKVVRSTTVASLSTREHRFHAKFNNEPEVTSSNPVKPSRGFSPKPPRGLYSSRKNKESFTKNKSTTTAQIPTPKKSNRYSSRYRSDASSRGAIRTSTNAPAYLPTIPTITPPTTSVKSSVAYQDKDLGVEVISFDDPVNTVPSANLVSGEYLASSTENHLTSPLVSASQTKTTEKPVSFIERIINSITAISTTEVPDVTRLTTPKQELPTKESAILKLATKKLDKTLTTQKIPTVTVTSEKPTTIIERILSSISAIQADNTTDIKNFKSKQVGTNFNTISSPSTTPLTRVTKSSLSAPISTSVNPLFDLDDIANDQILQKRTIDKLLALLNTMTTPSAQPAPLVVVTPKATNYVVGTSAATTTTTTAPTTTTTTTTEPTTTTTITTIPTTTTTTSTTSKSTTSQLFTSPAPAASLGSRANFPKPATVRYTTTPTITVLTTTRAPATTIPVTTTFTPTVQTSPVTTTSPTFITSDAPTSPITTTPTSVFTTTSPVATTSSLPTTTTLQSLTSTSSDTTNTTPPNLSNEIGANPLSVESGVTSTPSSTDSSTVTRFNLATELTTPSSADSSTISSTLSSTDFAVDTETNFAFPSTIPSMIHFEVSPGSVSVFNANDLSNIITPDDSISTTVTIPGRTNIPENVITTQFSTQGTTPTQNTTPVSNSADNISTQISVGIESRAGSDNTENNSFTSTTASSTTTDSTTLIPSTVTTSGTVTTVASTTLASGTTISEPSTTIASATLAPSTTTAGVTMAPSTPAATTTLAASTTLASSTTAATLTTLAPTTASSANNTTQDIFSNIIDTSSTAEKSNQTSTVSPLTNITSRISGRAGRLLNLVQDPVQNSLESSTLRDKDYYIFAVLNNNTVLRKRPSRFPTKDTPYLIVGVVNNTLVRKFPNGTLVPMEPIIRVSGFDTRENPPPLPEITSNQVTPDQGRRPENKNLQTVEQNSIQPFGANPLSLSSVNIPTSTTGTTPSSTVSSVQANPLSVSSTISSTTQSSTSTSTSSSSAAPTVSTTRGTTTSSTSPTATLPTLTEILNGRTVQAFNSIINISDLSKVQTLDVDPRPKVVSTTLPTPTLSNRILDDPTTTAFSFPTTIQQYVTSTTRTTTAAPTTTFAPTTTTLPSTTATFTSTRGTTVLPLSQPATTTFRTTTGFPSTTFFPTFLTTLFSTLRPRRVETEPPVTIVTPIPNIVQPTTIPGVEIRSNGDLLGAGSTRRPSRTTAVPTTTLLSTLPVSTTVRNTRRRGTTTTAEPTTTVFTTVPPTTRARSARRTTSVPETTTTSATKRLRELTDQQKKDLATLAQLEMEQAAILKQLSFLTNLNFANMKTTTDKNDLANRIIALAVERDKERSKTSFSSSESVSSVSERTRQGKKISPSNEQTLDELVKQLNINTPSTLTTDYGKSDDAIIAALLKEQGIGPTTPKALEDIYSLTTTTRKPRTTTTTTTTRRPGPLMQSLNWLLNVLAPPTTKRPRPKPKAKPKPKPKETQEELLTHQPTHITPVVTVAPRQNIVSSLSQDDIQKLIKQLETLQKDPQNNDGLDFSSIKSLQALVNPNEGVRVTSSGTTGTTTREIGTTTREVGTTTRETTPMTTTRRKNRVVKSTTALPLSVSNSVDDDEPTTARARVTLPPVRLRPVPGIEDSDTMVRGQLITAAVNVTRAISSFLGTALQGAATSFQSLLGSGSRVVGSLMQVSSNTSSRPG